jgi:hypothetical protein
VITFRCDRHHRQTANACATWVLDLAVLRQCLSVSENHRFLCAGRIPRLALRTTPLTDCPTLIILRGSASIADCMASTSFASSARFTAGDDFPPKSVCTRSGSLSSCAHAGSSRAGDLLALACVVRGVSLSIARSRQTAVGQTARCRCTQRGPGPRLPRPRYVSLSPRITTISYAWRRAGKPRSLTATDRCRAHESGWRPR